MQKNTNYLQNSINNLQDNDNLLPSIITHMMEIIGYQNTQKLINGLGGSNFDMPDYRTDNSQNKQILIDLIGQQATTELIKVFSGERVYIPKCHSELARLRNRRFCQAVQADIDNGLTKTQAIKQQARQFNITERWGRMLANRYLQLHSKGI